MAAASDYEPSPRFDHCSAGQDGLLYVWGGRIDDFYRRKTELAYTLEIFDFRKEEWKHWYTKNRTPLPWLHGGVCALSKRHLFIYGGKRRGESYYFSLHQLDRESLDWKKLFDPGPLQKLGSRMIVYQNKIIFFGGHGIPNENTPMSEFIVNNRYTDGRGWSNQLSIFNLDTGEWSFPSVTGTKPIPCSSSSLTMIDDHHAVLFGGNQPQDKKTNDVYILNLENMEWEKIHIKNKESGPVGRTDHSAVCLGYNGCHPNLLIIGGLNNHKKVLNDIWTLDVRAERWKKVEFPIFQRRCMHSAAAFDINPEITDVTIFGGCPRWPKDTKNRAEFPKLAATTMLRFEYAIDEWILTDNCKLADFAKPERLRRKGGPSDALYLAAYRKILERKEYLDMLFLRMVFLGPPGLGKTTARRRMTGEITNISSANEQKQPSTGAVESETTVAIRNLTSTTAMVTKSEWSVTKDLKEEARMLFDIFLSHLSMESTSDNDQDEGSNTLASSENEASLNETAEPVMENLHQDTKSYSPDLSTDDSAYVPSEQDTAADTPQISPEIIELFRKGVTASKHWKDIKHFFEYSALIRMEDTGGQPEFMDMLPALTIGPALYLLFCKLIDELKSRYIVSYSPLDGESSTPAQSAYSIEEVLLSALSSIACFNSLPSKETIDSEVNVTEHISSSKSVAYIVGTHKDLVSDEEQIKKFDQKLQEIIRSTDFFQKDLVQFSSNDRMILPIDNMEGGEEEIRAMQKLFEKCMQQHFKKLKIPFSWLILSLFLRMRTERMIDLESCITLAQELNMPPDETKLALWFLHHQAGVLMYFPDLPELQDTVICDIQIVYDSVTNLIVKTFEFGSVSKAASERFRETGQFSLDDIKGATDKVSGDFIPLCQLVKLLEYLNIIAPITQTSKDTFLMSCVLQNAKEEELDGHRQARASDELSPASIMIRYECGFVPIGVFPATIANLVGKGSFKLIIEGIKKNFVQFYFGTDRDTVTLHETCREVREIVESALKAVTSRMNYAISESYQLSFECPNHPGRDHLCVVNSNETSPHMMDCLSNLRKREFVEMRSQHLVWFGQPMTKSDGANSCPASQSTIGILTSDDHFEVTQLLNDLDKQEVIRVGLALGLCYNKMRKMDSIEDIIAAWLRKDDNVCEKSGNPSWASLINALDANGHTGIADTIRIYSSYRYRVLKI